MRALRPPRLGLTLSTDDDDSLDEDDRQLFASQRPESRRNNQVDDCGVIEQVEIFNFMCHKNYVFKLGPRINFICGRNGSGKSAVLTALVLVLGAKASATNRGSSLKDLVREGQENGTIVCRIKNKGDGPFMHDEFGDSIIIERHFSRSGASGFKIKNAKGKIISTKRSLLEEICDHFGYQVENPMTVLSQDLARQFVTSAGPEEKYKLFVKGVLLEQLDQDYSIIENNLRTVIPQIEDAKQDLKRLERAAAHAKSKADASNKYETMREQWRDWRRQLAWEQVRLGEVRRDEFLEEIKDADKKIEDAEAVVARFDETFQAADAQVDVVKEAHNRAKADVEAANGDKKEEAVKQGDAQREVTAAQAEIRSVKQVLAQTRRTIEKTNGDIETELQRLADLDGGGAAQRLRDLEKAEQAIKDAQAEAETHSNQRASVDKKIDEAVVAYQDAQKAVDVQKAEVDKQVRRLGEIRQQGGVQDTVFGQRMPALLKAIQQDKRFHSRPIGPLGKHIKLLHPEWSSILEKSFGASLNGFLVTSKSDQDVLADIQRRHNTRFQVMITSNAPLDSRSQEPDDSFLTIARALEIDHPLVRKILIIQNYIDNTVLIRDHAEASRVLFPESGPRPRNVPRCYCFHAKTRTKGFMLHYRGGRPAQDPIDEWRGPVRMSSSVEDQVRIQQGIVQDAKAQAVDIEAHARSCQKDEVKARQDKKRYQDVVTNLRVAVQKAEDQRDALNEQISEDSVKSGNLEALRESLKEHEGQLQMHEGSFGDVQTNLDTKKLELKAVTDKLNDFDKEITRLRGIVDAKKAEHQKADTARSKALGEKNAQVARVDDARTDRETMNQKLNKIKEELVPHLVTAEGLSDRVNFPEGETFDSLIEKYHIRKRELETAQKRIGGTREHLEAEKAKTAEAYSQGKRDTEGLDLLSTTLQTTMDYRRHRWREFQAFITVAAKFNFQFMLGQRGFRGQLILDHKKGLLDLKVEPDITRKSEKGRDARTLSGGEKSFSQLCLLLAIWEAMGSPIRCLDEFDVYMDAVNRNLSANLLIEGARKSTGKQFVLISPGSIDDIPAAGDVNRVQ